VRIFLLLTLTLNAYAGFEVGNGGGISENNILMAYRQLAKPLKFCLDFKLCFLSDRENQVLKKIYDTLEIEYGNSHQVVFKMEKEMPKGFFRDKYGNPRLAVTFSHTGSTIYFNRQLLYFSPGGKKRDISIETAFSILIHELGHHHDEADHTFLNDLGSKVVKYSLGKKWRLSPPSIPIFTEIVNIKFDKGNVSQDLVFIHDQLKSIDLTDKIKKIMKCETPKNQLLGFEVWQGSWMRITKGFQKIKLNLRSFCYSREASILKKREGDTILIGISTSYPNESTKLQITNLDLNYIECKEDLDKCLDHRIYYNLNKLGGNL
jgi:hypothetical protein